jgi:hypothetical protein
MLGEDFLGTTAFLEGAADLEPFVAAATADLVAFGAGEGGLGSDIRGRDIVGHVKGEMSMYTPQADDSPGRIVRCGSEKRNRTCGEEKVPNTD